MLERNKKAVSSLESMLDWSAFLLQLFVIHGLRTNHCIVARYHIYKLDVTFLFPSLNVLVGWGYKALTLIGITSFNIFSFTCKDSCLWAYYRGSKISTWTPVDLKKKNLNSCHHLLTPYILYEEMSSWTWYWNLKYHGDRTYQHL